MNIPGLWLGLACGGPVAEPAPTEVARGRRSEAELAREETWRSEEFRTMPLIDHIDGRVDVSRYVIPAYIPEDCASISSRPAYLSAWEPFRPGGRTLLLARPSGTWDTRREPPSDAPPSSAETLPPVGWWLRIPELQQPDWLLMVMAPCGPAMVAWGASSGDGPPQKALGTNRIDRGHSEHLSYGGLYDPRGVYGPKSPEIWVWVGPESGTTLVQAGLIPMDRPPVPVDYGGVIIPD